MIGGQLHIGFGQWGRLVLQKRRERLGVEHPDRLAVRFGGHFDEPPRIQHHGAHHERSAGGVAQQIAQPVGLGLALYHRIAFGRAAGDGDALAVVDDLGCALGGFAIRLGFDREHPGRADQDVIDVEAVADQVVRHAIAARPQGFQILPDRPLAIAPQAQLSNLAPEHEQFAGNVGDDHDRYHCVHKWLRWKVQPPPEPLHQGDRQQKHRNYHITEYILIKDAVDFLVGRLAGIARRRCGQG